MLPIISFLLSTVVISNSFSTVVESNVRAEASGESATTKTEFRTVIDGKETKFESNEPGEYRIQVNNEEIKITSIPQLTPTIISQPLEMVEIPRSRLQVFWDKFARLTRFHKIARFFGIELDNI